MAESERGMERKLRKLISLAHIVAREPRRASEALDAARDLYRSLPRQGQAAFHRRLLDAFSVPRENLLGTLRNAVDRLERGEKTSAVLGDLGPFLRSPLTGLFERIADLPGGLPLLMGLRADLLAGQRGGETGTAPLERAIASLLNEWFRHGFLVLREITPESPYRLIRYLKERELVHPMVSLEEMGQRLGKDRRCFGLFHCAMPDVPVVFIEVALTAGIPRSIHEIIEGDDDRAGRSPDTAVFYSINNTQNGLAGLGLGKVLVFRVTEALREEHKELGAFVTLSPIPGFWPRYLRPILKGDTDFNLGQQDVEALFTGKRSPRLLDTAARFLGHRPQTIVEALLEIFERPDWIDDAILPGLLRRPLVEIAHHYLTREHDPHGRPLNPVAGFHLGNGATVTRRTIHFAANRTPRGLAESCGLMVSYVYSERWYRGLRRSLGI